MIRSQYYLSKNRDYARQLFIKGYIVSASEAGMEVKSLRHIRHF